MTNPAVLFIGLDPASMDLSGAPAGAAARIQEGIDRSMRELGAAGFDATLCSLNEDAVDSEQVVRRALSERTFACVVIGAGLRLLPKHTALFEALVNATVKAAPRAKLAFNATPGDAADAVRRQFGR